MPTSVPAPYDAAVEEDTAGTMAMANSLAMAMAAGGEEGVAVAAAASTIDDGNDGRDEEVMAEAMMMVEAAGDLNELSEDISNDLGIAAATADADVAANEEGKDEAMMMVEATADAEVAAGTAFNEVTTGTAIKEGAVEDDVEAIQNAAVAAAIEAVMEDTATAETEEEATGEEATGEETMKEEPNDAAADSGADAVLSLKSEQPPAQIPPALPPVLPPVATPTLPPILLPLHAPLPSLPPPKKLPPKKKAAPSSSSKKKAAPPASSKKKAPPPPSSVPPKKLPPKEPKYFAVRVGYAASPASNEGSSPGHVSVIRSAIFLQWEDVKHFVEFTTSREGGGGVAVSAAKGGKSNVQLPFHHNVEYKGFDELERAEQYLKKVIPAFNPNTITNPNASKKSRKKLKSGKSSSKIPIKSGKMRIKSLARKAPMPEFPPPKNFKPPTKKWSSMFAIAQKYKAKRGNLDACDLILPPDAPGFEEHAELTKWIKYQRTSYRYYLEDPMGGRHSMTEEKVNRLKELGFDWIVEDKKRWLAEDTPAAVTNVNHDGTTKRKRGRPKKTPEKKMEEMEAAAAEATAAAQSYPEGTIINMDGTPRKKMGRPRKTPEMKKEEIAAAIAAGESIKKTRPIRSKWLGMLQKLKEYKEKHGTMKITYEEGDKELQLLKEWTKNQMRMHVKWRQGHELGMTQEKADMLKEIGMEFPPTWEEMYNKIVQYKAQNGDIEITNDYDPVLANWMSRQNEVLGRHIQGNSTRLSDDQAMKLLGLGFHGGRKGVTGGAGSGGSSGVTGKSVASRDFDLKWDEMWGKLRDYKNEHGHCNVSTSLGTELAHWVAAQRRMYNKLIGGKPGKRACLDAIKMQRLTELGFQFRPRGSYAAWDNQMKGLWKFLEENGHCRIPVNHPTLGSFVKLARRDYKNWTQGKPSSMTPERLASLKEVGFIFEGGKSPQRAPGPTKSWDERLQDLLMYKAEFGHTVVPQNSGQLGAWVHAQRVHYKKYKEGHKSQMTAEKALKLTEIGFCFNASDRYRGNKRSRTHEQEEEEAAAAEQHHHQQQQQQQHQHQQHQHHHYQLQVQETVHVPPLHQHQTYM
mmetsp:Transcript_33806/g.73100  ORF Transcript_33806/g.73100 Transcript_33806/m.73100 type:complete len:1083 (+) Transcript_33806:113-3361(+)